jgi:hypothetical protein
MLVAITLARGAHFVTTHRILLLNAVSTAACAVGILITRRTLPALFALNGPLLLDILAAGLLAYAAALAVAAGRQPIRRQTLMVFAAVDALWVMASAAVLLLFWRELAELARALVIVVAVAVEVFATLQFRAARAAGRQPIPA